MYNIICCGKIHGKGHALVITSLVESLGAKMSIVTLCLVYRKVSIGNFFLQRGWDFDLKLQFYIIKKKETN